MYVATGERIAEELGVPWLKIYEQPRQNHPIQNIDRVTLSKSDLCVSSKLAT